MSRKPNILFLCTGNSCRSQMAEGWGKNLKGNLFNFYSAGTLKSKLNKYAVQAMKELKIDISDQYSKQLDELHDISFDYIFTVCNHAHETCPFVPGAKIIHVGFDDPPHLTENMTNDDDIMPVYCRVRDEIKLFVENIEEYLIRD